MVDQKPPVAVLALHEAAHAVCGISLGYRPGLVRLTPPEVTFRTFHPREWADELTIVVAGGEAVRRLAGAVATGHDDADSADASRIIERAGVDALAITQARARAARIVDTQGGAIERVAAALLAAGSLTGERVRRIIDGATVDQAALFLLRLATADDSALDLGDKGERSQKTRLGKLLSELRDRHYQIADGLTVRVATARVEHKTQLWRLIAPSSYQQGNLGDVGDVGDISASAHTRFSVRDEKIQNTGIGETPPPPPPRPPSGRTLTAVASPSPSDVDQPRRCVHCRSELPANWTWLYCDDHRTADEDGEDGNPPPRLHGCR